MFFPPSPNADNRERHLPAIPFHRDTASLSQLIIHASDPNLTILDNLFIAQSQKAIPHQVPGLRGIFTGDWPKQFHLKKACTVPRKPTRQARQARQARRTSPEAQLNKSSGPDASPPSSESLALFPLNVKISSMRSRPVAELEESSLSSPESVLRLSIENNCNSRSWGEDILYIQPLGFGLV